jgi:hypothetical protein
VSGAEIYYDKPGEYVIDESVYGNAKELIVELWGGGGAGSPDCGSYSSIHGGGSGAYIKVKLPRDIYKIKVGKGGVKFRYIYSSTYGYQYVDINGQLQYITGGNYGHGSSSDIFNREISYFAGGGKGSGDCSYPSDSPPILDILYAGKNKGTCLYSINKYVLESVDGYNGFLEYANCHINSVNCNTYSRLGKKLQGKCSFIRNNRIYGEGGDIGLNGQDGLIIISFENIINKSTNNITDKLEKNNTIFEIGKDDISYNSNYIRSVIIFFIIIIIYFAYKYIHIINLYIQYKIERTFI